MSMFIDALIYLSIYLSIYLPIFCKMLSPSVGRSNAFVKFTENQPFRTAWSWGRIVGLMSLLVLCLSEIPVTPFLFLLSWLSQPLHTSFPFSLDLHYHAGMGNRIFPFFRFFSVFPRFFRFFPVFLNGKKSFRKFFFFKLFKIFFYKNAYNF